MTKRFAKCLLIAWLAVAVCVIPYREAKAVLLPLIIGLVTVSALGGASYCEVAGCFTPISGASVAQAVGANGVQRLDATLSDGTKIRTQLTKDGAKVPAPEAPSTVPMAGIASSSLPANTIYQARISYTLTGGTTYATPEACCQGFLCGSGGRHCAAILPGGAPVYVDGKKVVYAGTGIAPEGYVNGSGSCGIGYTASGSQCNVSDARLAVSDNAVDLYINEDGGLSFYSDADTVPENVELIDGGSKIWGTDSDGKPFVTEIKPAADGGATIKTQAQGSGGYVNESTITVGGDGSIRSVGESSAPGSISAPAGGGAPVVGVTGTAQAVQFPSDYAKTGEAAAAADKINAKLDKLNEALTKPGEPLADPTAPDGSEFTDGFFTGTFDNITSWRLPGHSSQCPTADLSFNAWGHFFDLNFVTHCQILESPKVQPVAEVAFVVFWLLAALFIVLGA